jgi:ketol-acid reductoisomerase
VELAMTLRILRGDDDAPIDPLRGKTVAVIGYGNQGRAHAMNLRESGVRVVVGGRVDSKGGQLAAPGGADGFDRFSIVEATQLGDLVIVALPDEVQPEVFSHSIGPNLKPAATIGFLHGFAIRYGLITPSLGVGAVLIAPKGPGQTLRQRFVSGAGLPCLYAMHQDSSEGNAEALALAWANGIGCARAGIICTSFKHETETDLFGEQAVLCGGMTQLILAAFETLVEAGYPPELAYLECCHEAKQIADLVYERGLVAMMKAISNTAEFGAYQAGPMLIDDHARQRLRDILQSVQDGSFADALLDDYRNGSAAMIEHRAALARHPIEQAGQTIRSLMPWLGQSSGDRST